MVLPIKEIAAHCREKEIITCFDGAQALGHLVLDMSDIKPDFYIASCHKWLMGPKGTGLLYIRKESQPMLSPTFVGAYTTKTFDLNSLEMEYETAA